MTYTADKSTAHAIQRAAEIGLRLGAYAAQAHQVGTAWLLSFGYEASMSYIKAGITFYCQAHELYASGISGEDLASIRYVVNEYAAMRLSLTHVQVAIASVQCGA